MSLSTSICDSKPFLSFVLDNAFIMLSCAKMIHLIRSWYLKIYVGELINFLFPLLVINPEPSSIEYDSDIFLLSSQAISESTSSLLKFVLLSIYDPYFYFRTHILSHAVGNSDSSAPYIPMLPIDVYLPMVFTDCPYSGSYLNIDLRYEYDLAYSDVLTMPPETFARCIYILIDKLPSLPLVRVTS